METDRNATIHDEYSRHKGMTNCKFDSKYWEDHRKLMDKLKKEHERNSRGIIEKLQDRILGNIDIKNMMK